MQATCVLLILDLTLPIISFQHSFIDLLYHTIRDDRNTIAYTCHVARAILYHY